ncbi:hypothetical protein EVAR_20980_1 [Eumeta japonica]|uniref:Uncharacterized protein n=1 Tax=Eumeta variegata TaxID=151549 RepID=A0A4C1V5J5_EUMVA|nr:hypothetical protein EVAR_20980_1 [Eumeta japonica]
MAGHEGVQNRNCRHDAILGKNFSLRLSTVVTRPVVDDRGKKIQQILMGDNSDNEDDLLLDEEDQRLLTQDDDQGIIDVEIEDTTLRQNETPDSLPGPSTSTAEPETEAQVTHQPAFKWSQRTYLPNIFHNVEYEFGKVKICQVEADTLLTPFDIFCAATNFDDLVHYIVSESVRYAHQNGREFTIEPEEMKAFLPVTRDRAHAGPEWSQRVPWPLRAARRPFRSYLASY